jgi:pimeloyl-ACP methyl ester carboxylesterase
MLHAYGLSPRSMEKVAEVVQETLPGADLLVPKLPLGLFSLHDPESVANAVLDKIDACVKDPGGYRRLIFVGHSLGAVLARKIWALAHGATPSGQVDQGKARDWAPLVDRLILLAAMGRGWMISSAQGPLKRLVWTFGIAYGNVCRHLLRREPLIFGIRRGAPFLTTTRLQSLAVEDWHRSKNRAMPTTVQLLGTNDDYVSPSDNVDLATGANFFYLEVKDASHKGIVQLKRQDERENFALALKADQGEIKTSSLCVDDVFDIVEEAPDSFDTVAATIPAVQQAPTDKESVRHSEVDTVVFVVHGIRDNGFWTKRIARRVKSNARQANRNCRTITSTYGYFPMGPFLLPWMRRAKVEWLLDQYVTAKALYPAARFNFIGHSNGTYLLAKSLDLCRAVRFDNVVFAGSVVRTKFDWSRFLTTGAGSDGAQVGRVVNYVATCDLVVAIFPHCMELLRLQDLGGAGHRGFAKAQQLMGRLVNIEHAEGSHSAALGEKYWDEISDFVLGRAMPNANRGTMLSPVARLAQWISVFIWLFLGGASVLVALMLHHLLMPSEWLFAIAIAIYALVLRTILTKA